LQQTPGVDLSKNITMATAGGGFGPVTERGYGVSYIVVGEDLIGFHISSKHSAENTVCCWFPY
jgi:carnitine O-palmitoyltransferase 1